MTSRAFTLTPSSAFSLSSVVHLCGLNICPKPATCKVPQSQFIYSYTRAVSSSVLPMKWKLGDGCADGGDFGDVFSVEREHWDAHFAVDETKIFGECNASFIYAHWNCSELETGLVKEDTGCRGTGACRVVEFDTRNVAKRTGRDTEVKLSTCYVI